jgi:hypothetical protein
MIAYGKQGKNVVGCFPSCRRESRRILSIMLFFVCCVDTIRIGPCFQFASLTQTASALPLSTRLIVQGYFVFPVDLD